MRFPNLKASNNPAAKINHLKKGIKVFSENWFSTFYLVSSYVNK